MTPTTNGYMLDVKNLSKKFGEFQAVKDLNFKVQKGEILGFLGPNGAGKTTTMRMITCYIPASDGTIMVDGLNTVADSLRVREKIGYLAETNPLYLDMTVREYLLFVGEIRGLKQPKLNSRIDEMFSICGLTKMAQRQVGKLSKGYRQRVGLAQSMMHNPDLLILDEPMSGLDPNQIIEIRQLIKKIGQEKTVIYCSHILPEVSATCSRIIIINEGQIVASGTADELTARSTRGNRFTVTIRADRAAVQGALATIPGVSGVTIKGAAIDWTTAEILCTTNDDLGEEIFKFVVSKGWTMSELKHETASLEDVFTQLTRG
jgi:ABC-2 type transport system ATP-binding protein